MKVDQFETTNAFVVYDLDESPENTGMVRLASKVLVDGCTLRARSVTYSLALFEQRRGGASAGINAKAAGRDAALTAWLEEAIPMVADRRFLPWPGTGLSADDLAPLGEWANVLKDEANLVAAGATAAADVVAGGLNGKRAAIVAGERLRDAVGAHLQRAGAEIVDATDDGTSTDADVLFVSGPPETLDHHLAELVKATTVVPISPVPVTTRALAVLSKAGAVLVPDFLALAGPYLAGTGDGDGADPAQRVRAKAEELKDAGTGFWVAAAEQAEAFLATWHDPLPFGRPLS